MPLNDGGAWMLLDSGEWLRGSLVRIRRGKLTFDSDGVGEQTFDLSEVERLLGVGASVVLTEDGRTFQGEVAVEADELTISGPMGTTLGRSEVLSVLAVDGERLANWKGRISLGATFRSGNTDQTDYAILSRALRETARTRWNSRYVGAITSVNDDETANNHRLSSQFDVYLTRRAFLTTPGVEIYRDRFQNIDLRATPYFALGYTILDGSDSRWAVSAGPAFRYQRLNSQAPGEDQEESSAAAVVSSQYSHALSGHIDLQFDYDLTMPFPDTDEYNHSALLSLAVDLPGDLDLDIAFIWDRVNRPNQASDGTRPAADDFRTTIGVGWSF